MPFCYRLPPLSNREALKDGVVSPCIPTLMSPEATWGPCAHSWHRSVLLHRTSLWQAQSKACRCQASYLLVHFLTRAGTHPARSAPRPISLPAQHSSWPHRETLLTAFRKAPQPLHFKQTRLYQISRLCSGSALPEFDELIPLR